MILQYLNKRRLLSLLKSFFIANNNQSDDMLATTGFYEDGEAMYPGNPGILKDGELTEFDEEEYYHNGNSTYPAIGDTVYVSGSESSAKLDGGSIYPYFDLSNSELIFYDSNYNDITDTSGINLLSGNDIIVVEDSVIKVYGRANYSGSFYGAYLRVPVVNLTEDTVFTFNVDNTKDTHNYNYQYAYFIDSDGNYFNYQNGFGVTNDNIDFFEEQPIDEGSYLSYSVNVPKELGYLYIDIEDFSATDNSGDNFYTVENLNIQPIIKTYRRGLVNISEDSLFDGLHTRLMMKNEYLFDVKTNTDTNITYTDIVDNGDYLTFNGTSSWVNQPMTIPAMSEFSITIVYRPDSTGNSQGGGGNSGAMLMRVRPASTTKFFAITTNSSVNSVDLQLNSFNGTTTNISYNQSQVQDDWNVLTVTYKNNTFKGYINGVLQDTVTDSFDQPIELATSIDFGYQSGFTGEFSRHYKGDLRLVSINSYCYSESEIQSMFYGLYTISSQGVVEDIKPINEPLILGTTGIIAEGEVYGPELLQDGGFDLNGSGVDLLTNGDFENGTTGWQIHQGSFNVVSGDFVPNGSDLIKQENILTVGTTYTVALEVYDLASGNTGKVQCGQNHSNFSSNGVHTFDIQCTDTPHFYVGRTSSTAQLSCKIKYVIVTEQGSPPSPWNGFDSNGSITPSISNSLLTLSGYQWVNQNVLTGSASTKYKIQIEVKNFDDNGGDGRVLAGTVYADFRGNGVKEFILTGSAHPYFTIESDNTSSFDIEYASVKEVITTLGDNVIDNSDFSHPTLAWSIPPSGGGSIINGNLTISQSIFAYDAIQEGVFSASQDLYLIEVKVSRFVSGVLRIYAINGSTSASQSADVNFERGAGTYYLRLNTDDDVDITLKGMQDTSNNGADFDIEKITARPITDGTWTGPYELEYPVISGFYNMVVDWGDGNQVHLDYNETGSQFTANHQYSPAIENPDVKIYTYEKMSDGITDADNELSFNKTNWNIHLKEVKQWGT